MPAEPRKKLAVLTCMDSRIDPVKLLDLQHGDAHVIRNAGGLATDDAIRSLTLSQHLLATREIMVIHHTRCGLYGTTDEAILDLLEQRTGKRPDWPLGAFNSFDELMALTLERLRKSPFLAQTEKVTGYVYDVDADTLTQTA